MLRTFDLLDRLVEFGTVIFYNSDGLPEQWRGQYIDSTTLMNPLKSSMPFARHLLLLPGSAVNKAPANNLFLLSPPDSEMMSIADMDKRLMSEPFYRQRRAMVFTVTFGSKSVKGDIHIGKTGKLETPNTGISIPVESCVLCGTCLSVCPMYTSFVVEENTLKLTEMNKICLNRHSSLNDSREDFRLFRLNGINCIDCGNCTTHCPVMERRELCPSC